MLHTAGHDLIHTSRIFVVSTEMQIVVVMNLYIDPIKTFIVLNVCNLRILNVVAIFAFGGVGEFRQFWEGVCSIREIYEMSAVSEIPRNCEL
jgi:hypothetical protein